MGACWVHAHTQLCVLMGSIAGVVRAHRVLCCADCVCVPVYLCVGVVASTCDI